MVLYCEWDETARLNRSPGSRLQVRHSASGGDAQMPFSISLRISSSEIGFS